MGEISELPLPDMVEGPIEIPEVLEPIEPMIELPPEPIEPVIELPPEPIEPTIELPSEPMEPTIELPPEPIEPTIELPPEPIEPTIELPPEPIEPTIEPPEDPSIFRWHEVRPIPEAEEIRYDEMEPYMKYEQNGYECRTDELGRPDSIGGTLRLEPGDRTYLQTEVGHLGLPTDEGGHLIAARFDGPTSAFNLVPQDANLNRSAWKEMENEWADALENGNQVQVEVAPVYLDDTRRPFGFDVAYQVGSELYTKSFYNESSKEEVI